MQLTQSSFYYSKLQRGISVLGQKGVFFFRLFNAGYEKYC